MAGAAGSAGTAARLVGAAVAATPFLEAVFFADGTAKGLAAAGFLAAGFLAGGVVAGPVAATFLAGIGIGGRGLIENFRRDMIKPFSRIASGNC